jgi:hypothetical protein
MVGGETQFQQVRTAKNWRNGWQMVEWQHWLARAMGIAAMMGVNVLPHERGRELLFEHGWVWCHKKWKRRGGGWESESLLVWIKSCEAWITATRSGSTLLCCCWDCDVAGFEFVDFDYGIEFTPELEFLAILTFTHLATDGRAGRVTDGGIDVVWIMNYVARIASHRVSRHTSSKRGLPVPSVPGTDSTSLPMP